MSPTANMPLAFGAILTGGWLLDRGIKDVKTGLASSSSGTTAASSSLPSGGKTHGLVSIAALTAIAKQHHWTAVDVQAWMKVIMLESNGTLTDTNPSSGAYGIAQFIKGPSEYYTYGGDPNTLTGQLVAMANYIAQRYGNPQNALAFHLANNYY